MLHNFMTFYTKLVVSLVLQIHTAIQQPGFLRVKRGFRSLKQPSLQQHHAFAGESTAVRNPTQGSTPTDPYFSLQWYLRNTGQNGGKVRLDLNVQAAWDQGITGKNVTTAIMDDGK
jgi:proprotein convertase subtilisin/kexin type 2